MHFYLRYDIICILNIEIKSKNNLNVQKIWKFLMQPKFHIYKKNMKLII